VTSIVGHRHSVIFIEAFSRCMWIYTTIAFI